MMRFNCVHCGKKIAVNPAYAGKKGKCPGCGQAVIVPSGLTPTAPESPRAAETVPTPRQTVSAPRQSVPVTTPYVQPVAPSQSAPVIRPNPTTAIQVNVQQPSRAAHSLGISSLVIGVCSLVICWIPFVGFALNGLGFVLGVAGLFIAMFRKGSGIGYSIAGTAINSSILVISLVFATIIAGLFHTADQAVKDARNAAAAAAARSDELDNALTMGSKPDETESTEPEPDDTVATESEPDGTESTESESANALPTQPESDDTVTTEPPPVSWTNVDSPIQIGDVVLRITDVVIGKVPLTNDFTGDGQSVDDLLTVWLEVTNTSERKKIDYRGWTDDILSFSDDRAKLTDDTNNSYRRVNFGTNDVKGAAGSTSLYPGKTVKDAIVFELPVDGAEFLRLSLPASACRETGEFRFEIPAAAIKRQ